MSSITKSSGEAVGKGFMSSFGNYPKEYNRAVHGPYYPWVNYGPKTQPLSEVKLGELPKYIRKMDKTPQAMIAAFSRVMYKYRHNWVETRYGSISKPIFHMIITLSTCSMLASYGYFKAERTHKYHW